MLEITDAAGKQMEAALEETGASDNECFRIVVTETALRLVRDEPQPEDVAFQHGEKVVLVLDAPVAELLKDRKIDYDEANAALVWG